MSEGLIYRVVLDETTESLEIGLDGAPVASRGDVATLEAAEGVLAQLGYRRFGRWTSRDGVRWVARATGTG